MSKVRRKVDYSSSRKTPSGGIVLAVIGLAVIAVVGLIVLTNGAKNASNVDAPALGTKLTSDGFPYKGADNAPVTIVIYSDYQCPHCRDFALDTEPLIDKNYVASGKVKIVAHYFNLWPETQPMTIASLCAAEQGKFWEFDHALFANQAALTDSNMSVFAHQVGLNITDFNTCTQSAASQAQVQAATEQGRTDGVTGTPMFFINGKQFLLSNQGTPFDQFRTEIEQALAGSK